jgi:hypothetical protein
MVVTLLPCQFIDMDWQRFSRLSGRRALRVSFTNADVYKQDRQRQRRVIPFLHNRSEKLARKKKISPLKLLDRGPVASIGQPLLPTFMA